MRNLVYEVRRGNAFTTTTNYQGAKEFVATHPGASMKAVVVDEMAKEPAMSNKKRAMRIKL